MRDATPTDDLVTVIEHGRLSRRRRPRGLIECDGPSGVRRPANRAGHGRRAMAYPDARPELDSRCNTCDEGDPLQLELGPVQVLAPAERDDVRARIDRADIGRPAERSP